MKRRNPDIQPLVRTLVREVLMRCLFLSDLHGNASHYEKLFKIIEERKPAAVFLGGDLLPNFYAYDTVEFITEFLEPHLAALKLKLEEEYPVVSVILGNDDPRVNEQYICELEKKELLSYINEKKVLICGNPVFGYSYVPPTPFLLKDWEKYDISRYVPRDSVSPEDGIRTFEVAANLVKYITLADDLKRLTEDETDLSKSLFLFHSPPSDTALDLIYSKDITGKSVQSHVGSIAIRRFIEKNQPLITMHGHIHESSEISGMWMDKIGSTYCYNASYEGDRLAIVSFDTNKPESATRELM